MLLWLTRRCVSARRRSGGLRNALSTASRRSSPRLLSTTALVGREQDVSNRAHDNEAHMHGEAEPPSTHGLIRRFRSRERQDTLLRRELRAQGKYRRQTNPSNDIPDELPVPPFMRTKKESTRFDKWYRTGVYDRSHEFSRKQKEKKAPFATAFALNPFAQALAGPVREDRFTGARLPRSCLQDFHLTQEEGERGVNLFPLGLTAEMIGKKKALSKPQTLTDLEKQAVEAEEADSDAQPSGSATYLVAKKEALDFVAGGGGKPEKRVNSHVINGRLHATLHEDRLANKVKWRPDMGNLVLKSLREIVLKKLLFFMSDKMEAKAVSTMVPLPKLFGLTMLDDTENVGCVLRLKPVEPRASDVEPLRSGPPEPKSPVRSHFYPNQTSFLGSTYGDWSLIQPAGKWAAEEAAREERGEERPEVEKPSWASDTQYIIQNHWSREESMRAPFLGHVLPLPPPPVAPTWYFPTIRYRQRRVPIFDLSYLLGEAGVEELLAATNLKDTLHVAVRQQGGTAPAIIWLLKLQAYLAKPKIETAKA